jgi:hypothetical protein
MNWRVVVCVLVPLTGSTGCTLARTAAKNLHNEPRLVFGDAKVKHRLRKLAGEALAECADRHPKKVFTYEFRDGFVDGFVDYLDSGGPCLPPAIPPYKYRSHKYLSPEGHAKVRDYFLGFKYGVDVAVATGWRPYLTIPVLVVEQGPLPPLNITALPAPPNGLSTDPSEHHPPARESTPLPWPQPVDTPPFASPPPVAPVPLPMVGTPPDAPSPNVIPPAVPPPPGPVVPDLPEESERNSEKSSKKLTTPGTGAAPQRPVIVKNPAEVEHPATAEESRENRAPVSSTAVIPTPIPIPVTVRPSVVPAPVVVPPNLTTNPTMTRPSATPIFSDERKAP